nr:hypothetical protein [Chroococcidiopsis sp. CCMEE 29]
MINILKLSDSLKLTHEAFLDLVEIYRLGQDQEVLSQPTTLSGEDVLPGFVLDLRPVFD